MKIKNYKIFLESQGSIRPTHYSIYDFFIYLRDNRLNKRIDESYLKENVDHFIGKGQWEKLDSHFSSIINSIKKVDLDNVRDRVLDVFDEYPFHKYKYVTTCQLYRDSGNYELSNKRRYNGMITVTDSNKEKNYLIVCFLVEILHSTLYQEGRNTRITNDEIYVTDQKWSISNLSKTVYEIEKYENSAKFKKIKDNFDLDKLLDLRRPGIFINLTNHDSSSALSLKKVRREFEEIMPSILSELDYEEVIYPQELPKDKEDIEIYDFEIAILLKMR